MLGMTIDVLLAELCQTNSSKSEAAKKRTARERLRQREKSTHSSLYGRYNNVAQVWTTQLSTTLWNQLLTSLNAALKIIAGCHSITDEDHLHQETKILPGTNLWILRLVPFL